MTNAVLVLNTLFISKKTKLFYFGDIFSILEELNSYRDFKIRVEWAKRGFKNKEVISMLIFQKPTLDLVGSITLENVTIFLENVLTYFPNVLEKQWFS